MDRRSITSCCQRTYVHGAQIRPPPRAASPFQEKTNRNTAAGGAARSKACYGHPSRAECFPFIGPPTGKLQSDRRTRRNGSIAMPLTSGTGAHLGWVLTANGLRCYSPYGDDEPTQLGRSVREFSRTGVSPVQAALRCEPSRPGPGSPPRPRRGPCRSPGTRGKSLATSVVSANSTARRATCGIGQAGTRRPGTLATRGRRIYSPRWVARRDSAGSLRDVRAARGTRRRRDAAPPPRPRSRPA